MPTRFWRLSVAAAVCLYGPAIGGEAPREYQTKGAFLVNFARFIEWPAEAFDGPASSIDFCVVGERWRYQDMQTTMENRQVANRPVRLRALGDTTNCHLLFVSGDVSPERFFRLLPDFTVRVGEQQRFFERGGHINFHLHGARVHFSIATGVIQQQRFRMSSRLLDLAHKERD